MDAVPLGRVFVAVEQPLEKPRLLAMDIGDRVGRNVGVKRRQPCCVVMSAPVWCFEGPYS